VVCGVCGGVGWGGGVMMFGDAMIPF